MKYYPNPTNIPDGKVWALLSMLNTEGGLAFCPQTCKETTNACIGQDVMADFKAYTCSNPYVDGRIDQKNPVLVFWTLNKGDYAAPRDATVGRIHDALHMLCEKMGEKPPFVLPIEKTINAIAVQVPHYFMMTSPVTMHGFMTFMRCAARNKHDTSSIYKFLDSVEDARRRNIACADISHIFTTKNLYDFLNKTLDFNIHNYNDWMLSRNGSYCWHGLYSYTSDKIDEWNPKRQTLTIDELAARTGPYSVTRRRHGEGYVGWRGASYLNIPEPIAVAAASPPPW